MKEYFLAPSKPKTLEVLVYKLQAIAHPYLYNKALRSYIYIYTRLIERFAPIFYLNCEQVLFVYILKRRRKYLNGFLKKITDFQEFKFVYKIKNLHIFFNLYYS